RVIAGMRKRFATIRTASRNKQKLCVYCEAWPNPRITSPPWLANLVEICGGKFIGGPGARFSDDDVAQANPDVIILAWAATGDRAKPAKIYAIEKWRDVPAIQNRRVFVVRDELLNTPAPILTRGARELTKILSRCR